MFESVIRQTHQQLQKICVGLIKGYQYLVSPLLGNRCRFHPSCSDYAKTALMSHGIVKGGYLTIKRLVKCHPLHPGGFDPVPKKQK